MRPWEATLPLTKSEICPEYTSPWLKPAAGQPMAGEVIAVAQHPYLLQGFGQSLLRHGLQVHQRLPRGQARVAAGRQRTLSPSIRLKAAPAGTALGAPHQGYGRLGRR
jgi:hypothetical protein